MMISRTYSTHRCIWHDYSSPGWYYLEFRTRLGREIFGDGQDRNADQNECRSIVETVASTLPDRYPEARVDTITVLPASAHILLQVLTHRNIGHCQNFASYDEWWNHRRTMTVPLIAGYFETHTGISINTIHDTPGERVWERRFGDRILKDEYSVSLVRDLMRGDPDGRIAAMCFKSYRRGKSNKPTLWSELLDALVRTRIWIPPFTYDPDLLASYKAPLKP